jgi:RecA/RadA recombinase
VHVEAEVVTEDKEVEEETAMGCSHSQESQRDDDTLVIRHEENQPVVSTQALWECQRRQPMMKAIAEYVEDQKLPTDRLQRIRVLETAPMYEVNQAGLLCRVRAKGKAGSLGMDLQVVVPEALRGQVIAGCHQGPEGHASVLKTFQKVRERFYWTGMFMDVQRFLRFCAECNLNAQVRSKGYIEQHVEATGPGESLVIDLLHYPKAEGYKYVLVAVDAYSRWAELAELENKAAATVGDELVKIITGASGHPKLIVSDQGSEFKGDLKAAMDMLRVTHKYTAAYRSEGHGLAERYNRALSDRLKSMVSQSDPQWHKALPWAKMAHNSSVHAALSDGGEGLTPAEVHLGRRMNINMEAGMVAPSAAEGARKPSLYAEQMAQHVRATKQWVKECREKYNRNMRRQANKTGRKAREFQVKELVRLQDVPTKGVARKLLRLYNGPYEVLEKTNASEYTIQKVGEGKKVKLRVHADRLAKYNDMMEMDVRTTKNTDEEQEKQEYEVEEVVDDTGSRKQGTKQYLVK